MKRTRVFFFVILLFTLSACAYLFPAGAAPISPTPTLPPATKPPAPSVTMVPPALPDSPVQMTNPGAPEVASYRMAVRLDPAAHLLSGQAAITYRNTTQKPIPDLVFHLYLNAFKSLDTVFMKESGGQLRGDPFVPGENGWIEVDSIKLKDGTALDLALVEDGTLARAALPKAVLPGDEVALELTFRAQLPRVFARTGWAPDAKGDPYFLVGQWFPKLGVWTGQGWNAHVFHGNAEFFADFGSYSVAITLPEGYTSGATGLPQGTTTNADGTQTVTYQASGVIDFAWTASPNLRAATQKAGNVEIVYLYLPEHEWSRQRQLDAAALALTQYSQWFGAYPYARLTVVDVPEEGPGAGGMEYPTFITIGAGSQGSATPPSSSWVDGLFITTAHEVAHQWWQSLVATNEAEEPWLDEGFADASTMLLLISKDGLDAERLDQSDNVYGYLLRRRSSFLRDPVVPMKATSWQYPSNDYVILSYAKPDMALLTLGRVYGDKVLLDILHAYFERYHFAHPTTADFQKVAVEVSGKDLSWFFDGLVYKSELVNYVAELVSGKRIQVSREGDLVVPVDIQVLFTDGSQQTLSWDGKQTENTFTFDRAVQSFDIDPQHKLFIELSWTDNDLAAR